MNKYNLDFIAENDLRNHVKNTILQYKDALKGYDLKKFNSNLIDPIKLTFDKHVYNVKWEQIIKNELYRQKDKTNSNNIGYFHQNLFKYIDKCEVPDQGFDVIYNKSIYVEMKNKHNTMNSSSSQKTYMKMQSEILKGENKVCYLVEIIAKKSGIYNWETTIDGLKVSNDRIKRVSIDWFLKEVTGDENAFSKLCNILPFIIEDTIKELHEKGEFDTDTVYEELLIKNKSIKKALFELAFNGYLGFSTKRKEKL